MAISPIAFSACTLRLSPHRLHKSVQDLIQGRNKPARRQPEWVFPAFLSLGMPETPPRATRLDGLTCAPCGYSGLLRYTLNGQVFGF